MQWDRFDICEAYYCYAKDYMRDRYDNSIEFGILGRLHHMGYRPGFGGVEYRDLTDNAKAIYRELIARFD